MTLHHLSMTNADEYYGASTATVDLSDERIAYIRTLGAEVRRLEVYKIAVWDCAPELAGTDDDGDGDTFRIEAVTLSITKDDCFWSGYYKYAGRWETESIRLDDLDTPTPPNEEG